MDSTFIALALFLFLALAIILLLFFRIINKKSFIADDGSVFDSQSDLETYKGLYRKTSVLFVVDDQQSPSKEILGFEQVFLTKLTREGFADFKTLFKYRKQIKSLSDLINI